MKKFLNSPETLLEESLDGFADAHADLCAGHVRRLGGGSPLCNLMEVKH